MEQFKLNNQIEKIIRKENSIFLSPIDMNYVVNILNKRNQKYQIFRLYKESEKNIVYTDNLEICLLEIECKENLTHREILGSLFSNNIDESFYGDIIVKDKCYIVVINKIKKYLENNLTKIGKKQVSLKEVNLETVKDYKLKFEEINLNVSSLRIDNIISKLIPTSRSITDKLIDDEQVILNYNILKNKFYLLKENDIFSIRRVGKFKYMGINKITKNDKYNIEIKKYI